jgi:hypothetical protein
MVIRPYKSIIIQTRINFYKLEAIIKTRCSKMKVTFSSSRKCHRKAKNHKILFLIQNNITHVTNIQIENCLLGNLKLKIKQKEHLISILKNHSVQTQENLTKSIKNRMKLKTCYSKKLPPTK